MITISLDQDWATGDCRKGDINPCAWQCEGCGIPGNGGRGQGAERPDSLERFARIRQWLMTQEIIAPVIVRDCHADIVEYLQPGDTVLNWDEHSDDGNYSDDDLSVHFTSLDCSNWVTKVRSDRVTVVQMHEMPFPEIGVPVRLFIAVSMPYTNEVCDEVLLEMLAGMGQVDFDLGVRDD